MLRERFEVLASRLLTALATPLAAVLVLSGQLLVVALVVIRAVLVRSLLHTPYESEPETPNRESGSKSRDRRRLGSATSLGKRSATPQTPARRECKRRLDFS